MVRFVLSAILIILSAAAFTANASILPEAPSSCDSLRTEGRRGSFSLLSGTYHCISEDAVCGKLASAGLFNIRLFPGYTTSIVRLNLYRANRISMPEGAEYYYGGTLPLLNGDFRVGGSLASFADVGFLFSYSYTPDCSKLKNLLFDSKLYHYVDRDLELFFGAELSASVPLVSASVRFGYRLNTGNLNFYSTVDKQYNCVPFDAGGFIVSMELRLVTSRQKGVNMIRLFGMR